ncbi:MAG: alpha/beta hydrolase [Fimbriimonadaceae bacterium]|nr:MAG: alpha/beta hydrolase [Fimbriimonadaceae bacterium]
MKVIRDVSYDTAVRGRQLDIFLPETKTAAPLVVLIHGGGWISGDRTTFHDSAEWFAKQGIAAACVGYRLAPLNPYPAAIDDVLQSIGFLRAHASEYNFDPHQIVSMGNSAGGHLACMAGLKQTFSNGEPAQNVNGVVSICSITDIRNPHESQYPVAFSFLDQFMVKTVHEAPEMYSEASPITHISENAPPFLIFHGSHDDIVPPEQSKQLYDALCQAGVSADLQILDREGHAFLFSSWSKIIEQAVEFVQTL